MSNTVRRLLWVAICAGLAIPALAQPNFPGGLFPIGGGSGTTTPGTLNTSCESNQGTGCGDRDTINHLEVCFDGDEDGVCDPEDECLDTPPDTPVFFNGCHLQTGRAIVLRGVNFEFDRADLTAESRPILERAVQVLQAQPDVLVTVDGHTDSMGSDAYNEQLSWRRVRSVYTFFINMGVDPARLAYRGFGESKPVAPNQNSDGSDNPAGRAANRRVELNVLDPLTFQGIKEETGGRFDGIEPGAPMPFAAPKPTATPVPPAPATVPAEQPAQADATESGDDADEQAATEPSAGGDDGYEAFVGEFGDEADSAALAADEPEPDASTEETATSVEDTESVADYLDEFGDYGSDAETGVEPETVEADSAPEPASTDTPDDSAPMEADDGETADEPYDYSKEFDY